MSKNLQKIYFNLGLMSDDKSNSTDTFSWQNSHASRLDVSRFIHQQPYWRSKKPIEEIKRKKIVLNSYFFLPPISQDEWNMFSFLLSEGFEIYTRSSPFEFAKLDLSNISKTKIQLCPTQTLQNELLNQGEDIKDYFIMDDDNYIQLYSQLTKFVEQAINGYNIKKDSLYLTRHGSIFDLTEENKQSLLSTYKNYKTIFFVLNNASFIWENTFSPQELTDFLKNLYGKDETESYFLKKLAADKLQELLLKGNENSKFVEVSHFKNLKKLFLTKMSNLEEIIGLQELVDFQYLYLESCSLPSDLPDLPNLKKITIQHGDKVTTSELKKLLLHCPQLEALEIDFCNNLEELDLAHLTHLKKLRITHCHALKKLDGLENIPLEGLDFTGNTQIINFKTLKNLREIKLDWGCDEAQKYKTHGLKYCINLEKIHLKSGIKRLNPVTLVLTPYQKLKELRMDDIDTLTDIKGIDQCKNLQTIQLKNVSIEHLDLSANTALEQLDIRNCAHLNKLIGLDSCTKLKKSKIVSCDNLPNSTQPSIWPNKWKLNYDSYKYDYLTSPKKNFIFPVVVDEAKQPLNKYIKNHQVTPNSPSLDNSLIFSSYDNPDDFTGLSFDTDTYTDPNLKEEVTKKFVNLTHPSNDPDVSSYRETICDRLEVDQNGHIILTSPDPFANLSRYTLPKNKDTTDDVYLSATTKRLTSDEGLVLSGLSAQDKLLDITDADKLNISYNDNTHQYVIHLKPGAKLSTYYLRFLITRDEDYTNIFGPSNLNTNHCPPLPEEIREALTDYFTQNENSEFVSNLLKAQNNVERFNLIVNYCRYQFENKGFKNPTNNDASGLVKVIKKARGSCRHRSIAAMALCHYFGIPVRINYNDCHAFIEAPVGTKKVKWKGYNLGGSSTQLYVSNNPGLDKSILDSKLSMPNQKPSTQQSSTPTSVPAQPLEPKPSPNNPLKAQTNLGSTTTVVDRPPSPLLPDYHAFFWDDRSWLYDAKNINEFTSKLATYERPTLIRIDKKNEAWQWHIALNNNLAKTSQLPVYIDSAEELKILFETVKIEDGDEKTIDGPIKKLIARGNGSHIVNWSNFDPTERVIYKSMMDDPPTLNGVVIPDSVHLVGLLPKNMDGNDVFMSRGDEIQLPDHLGNPDSPLYPKRDWLVDSKPNEEKTITVNLYHSADWSKLLVEELNIDGDQLFSKPGPLVTAMQTGLPIVIQNAPFNDETFCRFWHQLTTENKVMVNGEELTYSPGFKVYLETKNQIDTPPFIIMDSKESNTGKHYYITQENFNNLFELQYVDEEHRIRNKKNWLQKYKPGDQFIIKDTLSTDQWQRIYDTLTSMGLEKTDSIHFYQVPGNHSSQQPIPINDLDHWLKTHRKDSDNIFVESKDIHFTANRFKEELGLSDQNIFYLSDENLWSTFIENIRLYRIDKKIRADNKLLPLYKKLEKGETVILCGKLNANEFNAIETLFYDPPFLMVNGKKYTLPGKLVFINQPDPKITNTKKYKFDSNFAEYKKQLSKEIKLFKESIGDSIENFLKICANLTTSNQKYPNPADYEYQKIKSIYTYADTEKFAKNPLKPILSYHYRKDSEAYAFLNAMAKYHFSPSGDVYVNEEKLKRLLQQAKRDNDNNRYFWRIVNCLSAASIRYYLPDIQVTGKTAEGVPILSDSSKIKLETFILNYVQGYQPWPPKPINNTRYEKQVMQTKTALNDPTKSFIYLMGESGTGKTYTAKLIAKELGIKLCVGEDDIKRWLTHPEEGNILLLDEVNFAKPGKWEFLRGLKTGTVYYDGQHYPITTQKVLATGNGLHYNLRNFHPIIWDNAHIIWFGPFQPKFIEKQIKDYFQPIIQQIAPLEFDEVTSLIIQSYQNLQGSKQHASEITLRDIENICTRAISMKNHRTQKNFTLRDHVLQAIYDEMAGIFFEAKNQNEFKQFLKSIGKHWIEPQAQRLPTPDQVVIPPSKENIWRLIEDDLQIRDMRIEKNTNSLGKLGTLLEGPSGIGKSTIYLAALRQHGFKPDAQDSQKRYVQITAGSLNDEKELLAAFHGGSAVIIDELNANPRLEQLLNQLLTGVDYNNKPANKPGFIVFASQNPPTYAGVKISSRAIVNRLHKITMDDYSVADLEYIAEAYKIPEPKKFVQDFLDEKQKHPYLNSRNFFYGIKKYQKSIKASIPKPVPQTQPESVEPVKPAPETDNSTYDPFMRILLEPMKPPTPLQIKSTTKSETIRIANTTVSLIEDYSNNSGRTIYIEPKPIKTPPNYLFNPSILRSLSYFSMFKKPDPKPTTAHDDNVSRTLLRTVRG